MNQAKLSKVIFLVVMLVKISGIATAQPFDPVLAGKLQNKIDSIRSAGNLRGISACVIYPGIGTWKGVSGISRPGTPITSDMEFGIASNTKLFTGVLLLKLAENNIIDLDDSLHAYLPPYENIDPNITIRQLLNHTSGLDDVTSVEGYPDSVLTNPNRIFTTGEIIKWAGPPLFAAGTSWNYCNTNYLLAGMIAEKATGQSYAQLLRDSILNPLQLDSTFLDVYENIPYTIANPWQAGVNNISVPRKALNSAAWAAGAMYSTSGEMAQWYQALMSGKVINSNSLKEMTTFVGSGNYGIGISRGMVAGRTVWQHGGNIWGGYNSFMMYDVKSGIIICVLINQLPGQAIQIASQLLLTLANNVVSTYEDIADKKQLMIYPNPTDGIITVDAIKENIQNISVYNTTGQLLKETTETRFSIADLPGGIYFIHAQTDKGISRYNVIKQ